MCISVGTWGLIWDSVTMHRMELKQKSVKEIMTFYNLMQGGMRFTFQGVNPCFRRLKFRVHPGFCSLKFRMHPIFNFIILRVHP